MLNVAVGIVVRNYTKIQTIWYNLMKHTYTHTHRNKIKLSITDLKIAKDY